MTSKQRGIDNSKLSQTQASVHCPQRMSDVIGKVMRRVISHSLLCDVGCASAIVKVGCGP